MARFATTASRRGNTDARPRSDHARPGSTPEAGVGDLDVVDGLTRMARMADRHGDPGEPLGGLDAVALLP